MAEVIFLDDCEGWVITDAHYHREGDIGPFQVEEESLHYVFRLISFCQTISLRVFITALNVQSLSGIDRRVKDLDELSVKETKMGREIQDYPSLCCAQDERQLSPLCSVHLGSS